MPTSVPAGLASQSRPATLSSRIRFGFNVEADGVRNAFRTLPLEAGPRADTYDPDPTLMQLRHAPTSSSRATAWNRGELNGSRCLRNLTAGH